MINLHCGFRLSVFAGLVTAGVLALPGQAAAQAQPRSFDASPDIYKVIAQSADYQVIEVTWKPGQKDVMHSHPASGVYYLTACSMRLHLPDGSYRDGKPAAGMALVQTPIPAHVVENIGASECKLIMFEPK